MALLKGKKTYLVGVLMILYGALGGLLGKVDQVSALTMMGEGLGFIFLRAGIAKS